MSSEFIPALDLIKSYFKLRSLEYLKLEGNDGDCAILDPFATNVGLNILGTYKEIWVS